MTGEYILLIVLACTIIMIVTSAAKLVKAFRSLKKDWDKDKRKKQ